MLQLKVGAGARNLSHSEFSTIYALVQCTRNFHQKIAGDACLGFPNSFKVIFRLGSKCYDPTALFGMEKLVSTVLQVYTCLFTVLKYNYCKILASLVFKGRFHMDVNGY